MTDITLAGKEKAAVTRADGSLGVPTAFHLEPKTRRMLVRAKKASGMSYRAMATRALEAYLPTLLAKTQ